MKVLHVIPGVGCEEREPLRSEHRLALKSLTFAIPQAPESWEIEVLSIGSCPEWMNVLPQAFSANPQDNLVLNRGGIRPKLSNFLHGELPTADLVVFSNADIIFAPGFYREIAHKIASGYLAGSVNRRTVMNVSLDDPNAVTSTINAEETFPHPGSDCFFFPGALLPRLDFGGVLLGVPPVGRALLSYLAMAEPSFRVFKEEHITFHIGDARVWQSSPDLRTLARGNFVQWVKLWPRQMRDFGLLAFTRGLRAAGRGSALQALSSVLRGLLLK